MLGELNMPYSLLFGAVTVVAVFLGIKGVDMYIKKGKGESVIAILLIICLTLALISVPIKMLLIPNKTPSVDSAASVKPVDIQR